jgi:putative membrane protein
MYISGGARITKLIWNEGWPLVTLAVLAVLTELVEPYVSHLELFSVIYVGVFSTALSIFLVFRFNESYERWWEARTLWGDLVNASRDFTRQVLTLLGEAQVRADGRRLVYRQIAFVHALRICLREGDAPEGASQMQNELRRLLPDEAEQLLALGNIPNALLRQQSELIAGLLRGSTEDRILLARFDTTLGRLHNVQGGCERIKNTAFPDAVSVITRVLVWGLVLLLLLATVGPSGRGGPIATIAVCIMAMGYIWIDTMGRDLKDPFKGAPNDTPMTSLSINIERDLREMLGETDLPEPARPVRGVLM